MKKALFLVGITTALTACSKSSSSDDAASTTTTSSSAATGTLALVPSLVLSSPTGSTSTGLRVADDETALDSENPKAAQEALDEAFANATEIKDCLIGLGRTQGADRTSSCYGPSVLYRNHPDGSDMNPAQMPSGDLGFFEAAESTGEACVAAKMNEMSGKIRKTVKESIETGKRALCFATVLGKTLPTTAGDTLDLTDDVNAALEEIASDVEKKGKLSFTTITITLNEISATGNVYQTDVEAEIPRGSLWTRVVTKKYSDTHTKGYIWGVFTESATTALAGAGGNNNGNGGGNGQPNPGPNVISVIYEKDGDVVNFDSTKSNAQSTEDKAALEADKTSLFESDKRVRVASTGNPGYSHALSSMDTATGAGEIIFMWTAGQATEEQRTLHAKVTVDGDSKTGWGYFGFGPKLGDFRTLVKAGTVTATQQSIEKMVCNWAGPGSSHTGVSYAQKQVITFDTTLFKATTNNIGFAGRNNCGQGVTTSTFEVAKGNVGQTVTYAAWPTFSLIDISSGEDKTNLQTVHDLLLDATF